ncbi:MAG: gamma-butyrobetaine hydroxylase-like domain-containing protein, partial [Rhodospirillales bacterium]
SFGTRHHPKEIRLKRAEKVLEIDFEDGRSFSLPAELLRVESPSADVQGHGPDQKTIVPGRRHVGIMAVEPVGNYAIRIKFDDLHDTGIFSWDTLYDYGDRQDELWQDYLDALDAKGLSRDP